MRHTLNEVRREYDRLDALCGVNTKRIVVRLTGAVQQLGLFRAGPPMEILLSVQILDEDELFWNTIRHEYAHALVYLREPGSSHGHDAVWKAACREVGCRPEAKAEPTEAMQELRESRARYKIVCKGCGQETLYLREGKILKLLASGKKGVVRCRRCGGTEFDAYWRE